MEKTDFLKGNKQGIIFRTFFGSLSEGVIIPCEKKVSSSSPKLESRIWEPSIPYREEDMKDVSDEGMVVGKLSGVLSRYLFLQDIVVMMMVCSRRSCYYF